MTAPSAANSPNLRVVDQAALKEMARLTQSEIGTEFGFFDRMGYGWDETSKVLVDYADWEARDLTEMLKRSARARQIESVLTLPLMASEWKIEPVEGDTGEAAFLTEMFSGDELGDGCETPLQLVIDQMTSAIGFKKAFFELVWTTGTEGKLKDRHIYAKVAWRPQTTCRPMRDPQTGKIVGFEQESYYSGPDIAKGVFPFKIRNVPGKAPRAFVYINGKRRDPINGVSELEIAYWAYKTKQRILLLWFQYLESVSLPIKVVYGADEEETKATARSVAGTRGGGTVPVWNSQGPSASKVEQLDVSGKGAEQFLACIKWLDAEPANAVLAGFVDMPSNAGSGGGGSKALSEDASDFFLQSEEGRLSEAASSVRVDLFAPVIRANFGRKGKVPKLTFEPLTAEDKAHAFTLLQGAMASRADGPPAGFVAMLAEKVAAYLGMDAAEVKKAFNEADAKAEAAAKVQAQQTAQQFGAKPNPVDDIKSVHNAVATAHKLIRNASTAPGITVAKPAPSGKPKPQKA